MLTMDIRPDTPLIFVLESYPQALPLFQSIGMCCVNDANMNSTVGEVCAVCGVDAENFIENLKNILER